VAKVLFDIRMVYDGTKSGLNDSLFVPWFMLRTSSAMTRTLDVEYFCGDTDLGECFLNFWAHEALIPYLGVDLTHTFPGEPRNATMDCEPFACKRTGLFSAVLLLVAWVRCAMGLKPSPYYAAQCTTRAKRICLGDPRDPTNVYRWSKLQINQPDQLDYKAHLPWAYKVRDDGKIAADNHGYIDDNRQTAHTKEE
jgi:hypothetical protein